MGVASIAQIDGRSMSTAGRSLRPCAGAKSPLHPGVMRMCPTTCARFWAFSDDGIEPAAERVDGVWKCANLVPIEPIFSATCDGSSVPPDMFSNSDVTALAVDELRRVSINGETR